MALLFVATIFAVPFWRLYGMLFRSPLHFVVGVTLLTLVVYASGAYSPHVR